MENEHESVQMDFANSLTGSISDAPTVPLMLEQARLRAKQVVDQLWNQVDGRLQEHPPPLWLSGRDHGDSHNSTDHNEMSSTTGTGHDCSRAARFFHATGFLHITAFCTPTECANQKQTMADWTRHEWIPDRDDEWDSFGTDDRQNTARGDYFLQSADRVHFFAEPAALVEDDHSDDTKTDQADEDYDINHDHDAAARKRRPRVILKDIYRDNKIAALNKVGHALHMRDGPFRDYCLSDKVRNLVTDLGWQDPIVPQSMYIFKQAVTGGVVNSHQDSTFLFTTPRQTCLGLWVALDDATISNGCLWIRPQSHREPVRRQYKRNPAHYGSSTMSNSEDGDPTQPAFVMETLYDYLEHVPWEGQLPTMRMMMGKKRNSDDDDDDHVDDDETQMIEQDTTSMTIQALLTAGFIPVECRAGDLLAFCGELDHLSLPNQSNDQPRHTFQLHLVEGPRVGVTWSPSNWLQYPAGRPFQRLHPE